MKHSRITRTAKWGWLLAFGFAAADASAANTVVYRCLDVHLGVVYTDLPCKDGQAFDTRAGDADPAAVARLERLRDALDQSAAQRISEERRLAASRPLALPPRESEAPPEDMSPYGYYTYPVAGTVFHRPHPHRPRPSRPHMVRGGAPPPPYIIPRP